MIDVDQLPIPDWGLRCPDCQAFLAGMRAHRCERCGRQFSIRQLLAAVRPIPDIGLACRECGYLLTGLVVNRCPECGAEFSVREMLEEHSAFGAVYLGQAAEPEDHHLAKRPPVFTGRERPLPDFGLGCASCDHPLAGAEADRCPACNKPFDILAAVPRGDWVAIGRFVPRPLAAMVNTVLYGAQIPYLVDNARLTQLYGGQIPFVPNTLRVPRPFFFDALHAMATAERAQAQATHDWTCPACHETVPAGFDLCWNCNAPYEPS